MRGESEVTTGGLGGNSCLFAEVTKVEHHSEAAFRRVESIFSVPSLS